MMLDPVSRPPRQLRDPRNVSYKRAKALLILPILFLVSCALMTEYDPTSYKTGTDLKAESLILMDKAVEPPDGHLAKIEDMRVKLSKAYEYEKGKDGPNTFTVGHWETLNNPDGGLLGGFLTKWEGMKGTGEGLNPELIPEAKKNVEDAFNQIIKLESAKVKN